MNSYLEVLENLSVKGIYTNHETQILFEGNILLNIFNKWKYPKKINELKNHKLKKAQEIPAKIHLIFEDDSCLEIDLSDGGYLGPEALELIIPGKSPIVWN